MTITKIIFISLGIAVLGCIPFMGTPGALILYLGKPVINLFYGPLAFEAWFANLGDKAWPLSIIVTLIWPIFIPVCYLATLAVLPGAGFLSVKSLTLFFTMLGISLVITAVVAALGTKTVKHLDNHERLETAVGVGDISYLRAHFKPERQKHLSTDPLKKAIFSGNVTVANFFINKRENLDAYWGDLSQQQLSHVQFASPLHTAVSVGSVEITQALLEKSANANIKNTNGQTPVHALSWDPDGNGDIIRLLQKYGADFSIVDNDGNTAVTQLTKNILNSWPQMPDYIELLVSGGANHNRRNDEGKTALDYAVENHHTEAITYLESLQK